MEPFCAYTFGYLDPNKITVNCQYQRDFKKNRVEKMVSKWDDSAFNPIKVNMHKDGTYTAFDGQHSLAGWKRVRGNEPVPCLIYKLPTEQDEASLFVKTNTGIHKPLPGDIIKASVFMNTPEDVAYQKILDDTQTAYTWDQTNNNPDLLSCHSFLKKKVRLNGSAVVSNVLNIIRETGLNSDPVAYTSGFLGGFIDFMELYKDEIDEQYLKEKLLKEELSKDKKTGEMLSPIQFVKDKALHYLHCAGKIRVARTESARYYTRAFIDLYNFGFRFKTKSPLNVDKFVYFLQNNKTNK